MLILIFSVLRSASIFVNTAENCGLLVCIRLLLASAMLRASLRICVSCSLKVSGLVAMCVVLVRGIAHVVVVYDRRYVNAFRDEASVF